MLLFFFFFYSSEEPSQMRIVYKNLCSPQGDEGREERSVYVVGPRNCSGREDKAAHLGESSTDSHVNAVMLVDRYLDGKRKR